jgi:hypothetical protein
MDVIRAAAAERDRIVAALSPAERDEWNGIVAGHEFFDGEVEIELSQLRAFVSKRVRERAEAAFAEKEASFARSDTDGFVSQWANGIMGAKHQTEADLIEAGSKAEFRALFDLNGNWVPAKELTTRFGTRWMVLDANGRSTGKFLAYGPKRRETLAKHGYVEGFVVRPAKVTLAGGGHGLAGAANVYVAIVPADRDWDRPLAIVSTDRWAD